ncbi:MAG: hypothetical protein ACRDV6_04210, partial [Acidimicrobiales bacterium]
PAALDAPPRTVLNLNVPTLPLAELRGVVAGQIGDVGIVKDANARMLSPSAGIVELVRGTAIPSLGDTTGEDPADDAALIGAGFATLTALHGVGEDRRPESQRVVEQALEAASHRLSS